MKRWLTAATSLLSVALGLVGPGTTATGAEPFISDIPTAARTTVPSMRAAEASPTPSTVRRRG